MSVNITYIALTNDDKRLPKYSPKAIYRKTVFNNNKFGNI